MKTLIHTTVVSLTLALSLPVVGAIAPLAHAIEPGQSANCESSLHPTTMGGTARSALAAQGQCKTTANTSLQQAQPVSPVPASSVTRPGTPGNSPYPAYCQIPMVRMGDSMWLQLEALERCRNGA